MKVIATAAFHNHWQATLFVVPGKPLSANQVRKLSCKFRDCRCGGFTLATPAGYEWGMNWVGNGVSGYASYVLTKA